MSQMRSLTIRRTFTHRPWNGKGGVLARRLPPWRVVFEPVDIVNFALTAGFSLLFATAFVVACSRRRPSRAHSGTAQRPTARRDLGGRHSRLGRTSYKPGTLWAVGSVSGNIKLEGPAPRDTTTITSDQKLCGTTAEAPIVATAKGISNAVVWIAGREDRQGVADGKRISLSSENCILDPRVEAVIVGTTVNVFNDDKLLHRLVFTRAGTNDTLTVMPFFNVGQIVPRSVGEGAGHHRSALRAASVDARLSSLVFDQPYFAVTEDDGSFKIDSLAPGHVQDDGVARGNGEASGAAGTGRGGRDGEGRSEDSGALDLESGRVVQPRVESVDRSSSSSCVPFSTIRP